MARPQNNQGYEAFEKARGHAEKAWDKNREHAHQAKLHDDFITNRYHSEQAGRYRQAANYLEDRAARHLKYGSGHDMAHHGEGKKHGEK